MESKQPISLTVNEAIEQGYKYYTGQDYESHWRLKEGPQPHSDFDKFVWYLIDKEPTILTVSPSDIYEELADNFAMNNEVGDENDNFGDLIRTAINWQEIAEKINAALKSRPIYFPTKIKLVSNGK